MKIGVDPGCTGSLVALVDDQPVEWLLMPTIKVGSNTRVNGAEVAAWLRQFHAKPPVFLEFVGILPKQGASSAYTFGHATGTVHGVIQGLDLPLTLVAPQKWKKAAGLIGTDKDAARARASMLWPGWRDLGPKGKGQALADAALIAKFGSGA